MTPHPPKPRLTLRIGITGHRPNKLDANIVPRLRQQITAVFAAIEQAATRIRADADGFYADDPPALRLISGFAQGADQLAVEVCPASWQVEAILPFPADEYAKDFAAPATGGDDAEAKFRDSLKKAAAVTALPAPPAGWRDQGYVHAGGYLLQQIDILVAVWDGLPPKPGGTGAVLREAHAGGIPVVWLATRDDRAPRLLARFDNSGAPVAADTDCTTETLVSTLLASFAPPRVQSPSSAGASAGRQGLKRYLGERWRRRCFFATYDALRRLAHGNLPRLTISYPTIDQRAHDWDEFIKLAPDVKNLSQRVTDVLLPRYIWADTLAVHFSHLYRSAYVFAYLLSALAVFIALGTVFIHDDPGDRPYDVLHTKAIFVICELVVIALIILAVWAGRRLLWHERWLNYRMLAEMLRHGRFFAYLSEFGRTQATERESERLWMLWYIRATMREIGLPTATLDGNYQKSILNATLVDEITGARGQIRYHQTTHESANHIDHLLHRLGVTCFVATSMILIAFLALFGLQQALGSSILENMLLVTKPIVTFLSAGLPALGAAVAGIRVHGDFDGQAERSAKMVDELNQIKDDYEGAIARGVILNESADLLIRTAGIMSEDLAVWQALYGRKRLALPA
jgi:hypothetical protein